MKKKAATNTEAKAAPLYQNQVRLVGYLGDNPEIYENRAILSLATKVSWKPVDSNEWKEHTDWHRVSVWGKLLPGIATLAKGNYLLVDGELRSSTYEREVQIVAGGTAKIEVKAWEIRAKAVRKLVYTKKAQAKAA